MSLAYENKVALDLVQAMWGSISPNMRSVSFKCIDKQIVVIFVIENESDEDREEASDIICGFESLQDGPVDINYQVVVSSERNPNGVGSVEGRPIFVRKES